MAIATTDLAYELTNLVLATEKLHALVSKLEASPLIDKKFSAELGTQAALAMAAARQAARSLDA
jgi:hypothetical protein